MDTKLTKVRRQFSLRAIKRRLGNGRTNSECHLDGETDVDHLLENCEQIDGVVTSSQNQPSECETSTVYTKKDFFPGTKKKANSLPSSSDDASENEASAEDLDKYKIPSSMIVLNDDDKKRLEYVLLQIGLREVGLG